MNKERAATLLASGLKAAQVASIIGVSPGRISQLLKEDVEFQNLVLLKTSEQEKESIEEVAIAAKYLSAEHALIDQVISMAPMAELRDVTNALRVVSERQEKVRARQNPVPTASVVLNQVVQIAIPNHAVPEITLTKEKQVVSIGNQLLAPLTSEGVTTLFKNLKNAEGEQNELQRLYEYPSQAIAEAIPHQEVKEVERVGA